MADTVQVNGNGKTTVWGVVKAVISALSVGAIAGAVYGYGALNNRVDTTARDVVATQQHVERVDAAQSESAKELKQEVSELRVDIKEALTDLKWLKRQMRGNE